MKTPDLNKLSGVLGHIIMRLLGISWRVFYISPCGIRNGRIRNRSAFFVFWHGRQLPLIYTHRDEGSIVLVSKNRDGQYATNVLHSMGFSTARGSSSRGGLKALREIAGELRSGFDCAITPDGPRGPAERAKTGMAHISRLGGRPVVPMGSSGWPAFRFPSWDKFLFPLPFARITVVEGRPFPPLRKGDDVDIWMDRIEMELNRVTCCADLFASPSARFLMLVMKSTGRILQPVAELALKFRSSRERKERQGFVSPANNISRPVWLHGSSLGELNGLLPFVSYLKKRRIPVWITCFTPSGRSFIERMNLPGSYAPLDVPRFAERFIQRLNPRAFIIAETEIWPNTITSVIASSIPCMIVNGRLSRRSLKGYRILKPYLRRMLLCFSGILVRSNIDAEYFESLGAAAGSIIVTGDAKACSDHGDPPGEWRTMLQTDRPVLVAGSTRNGEEEIILRAARAAGYFPVLVPRHLERTSDVCGIMKSQGFFPVKWSELTDPDEVSGFDSVVVDIHGILAKLYGVGDMAFVGGTLVPIGGHNVLEPLMRGVPFIVGPHYESFSRIVDELSTSDAGHIITTHGELADLLIRFKSGFPSRSAIRNMVNKVRTEVLDEFELMLRKSGILKLELK